MEDSNPDTAVMLAGLVLSAVAAIELYTNWKELTGR